jgi:hypothetical protein
MMFIPATGKVNYTQAKAYCPISLLSFTQKMMQKFKTVNVRDETLGNVPIIYKNGLQTRKSTETTMHDVITHIQEAVEDRKLHLSFARC